MYCLLGKQEGISMTLAPAVEPLKLINQYDSCNVLYNRLFNSIYVTRLLARDKTKIGFSAASGPFTRWGIRVIRDPPPSKVSTLHSSQNSNNYQILAVFPQIHPRSNICWGSFYCPSDILPNASYQYCSARLYVYTSTTRGMQPDYTSTPISISTVVSESQW